MRSAPRPLDKFPELETPRLRMVPFNSTFVTENYITWLNDPRVVAMSELRHHVHDRKTCESYLSTMQSSGNALWAILERANDDVHVGNIAAMIDARNETAELSILIGETTVWGNGYATEVWERIMDWLLTTGEIRKVYAGTMSTNHGMRNVMRRTGMQEEAIWHGHRLLNECSVDLIFAAKFRQGI